MDRSDHYATIGAKPDGRLYKKLVLCVLVITGLLCLAVFTLCGFFFFQNNSTLFSRGRDTISPIACVQCSDLIKHTNDDPLLDTLSRFVEDGVEKCCAYNSRQMSALLELSMRRKPEKIEPLPEFEADNFTLSMASAHKKLYPPSFVTKGPPEKPTFGDCFITTNLRKEIVPNGAVIEHLRGVNVSDDLDGLEIVHPGMYQVYSMVDFSPDSLYKCKDFDHKTFEFYIVLKGKGDIPYDGKCPNDKSHITLFSASHTCCDECNRDDKTKYSGGMFSLEKGDVVQMKTTAHDLVFFKKQVTFIGLFMLGAGNDGPI